MHTNGSISKYNSENTYFRVEMVWEACFMPVSAFSD